MLDFWVKFKEIELYVQHEVDNPIIIDEIFLLTTGEGDVEGVEVDGEGDDEWVESDGECDLEKVDEDIGMESGGHISLGSTVGEGNNGEIAVDEYTGDFATSDGVDNVADEYADDFTISDVLDNVVAARSGEEEDRNKAEVWDSDEHGSLVGSDEDKEHEDGERRRSKFPLFNDKLKFSLEMLFKDGKQFKSAIQKYFKECRKQLKLIKNEPKRVVVVVEVECTDSWGWFLSLLSTDLGLENGYGYTIISDQQKIVKYTTEREWEDLCSALEKKDKDAYDNLMKKSLKMWTRAFLGTICKSDIVDNNLCEAFNSSIVEAWFKSIIIILEDIRTKMMTRIVQKRKLHNGWKQNYGPLAKAKFDANKKGCVEW
ncbi:hypothetical protein CXB51_005732 [Gossypium anomalum]|uniref:Transposase MuDR plant domain-containing protein n=1 Tax=Gossypium anomalum TaxID=47600 RepID=A0A8J6DCA1_9ROSI|nr:hypothetical protein CXB51_005732 [Gossypium anomalum]